MHTSAFPFAHSAVILTMPAGDSRSNSVTGSLIGKNPVSSSAAEKCTYEYLCMFCVLYIYATNVYMYACSVRYMLYGICYAMLCYSMLGYAMLCMPVYMRVLCTSMQFAHTCCYTHGVMPRHRGILCLLHDNIPCHCCGRWR